MKRKDWLSIAAFLVIYLISLVGYQFVSEGSWGIALITTTLLAILVIVFYLFSIFARNRKGNYMGLWSKLGYVSFVVSIILNMLLCYPFMHFFNVIGNQEQISNYVNMISVDTDKMFDSYKKAVIPRADTYDTQLRTSIKLQEYQDPSSIISQAFPMQKHFDSSFANKTSEQWKIQVMLKNWKANSDNWKTTKSKEYKQVLIDNFNIFTAAKHLSNMTKQYEQYKDVLSKDFKNLTPYEKEGVYKNEPPMFSFDNKETEWVKVKDIFTNMEFSFFPFLLFVLLSTFMLSSFVFIKDEKIKSPHKNKNVDGVYELGIKL